MRSASTRSYGISRAGITLLELVMALTIIALAVGVAEALARMRRIGGETSF